jgi:hypothetical protein
MNNYEEEDLNEKEDRKKRYQRRRGHVPTGAPDDSPRHKRRPPYKRENIQWDDEEWLDELE